MFKSFSSRLTVVSGTSASPVTSLIQNGESIKVLGFYIDRTVTAVATVTFADASGNTLFVIISSGISTLDPKFRSKIPWIADKGLQVTVSVSSGNVSCTIFHTSGGA